MDINININGEKIDSILQKIKDWLNNPETKQKLRDACDKIEKRVDELSEGLDKE